MKNYFLFLFLFSSVCIFAQDPRERMYLYEVLNPSHQDKPLVKGFAEKRIVENLNRGVIATVDDKGEVYVSWRLLNTDPGNIAFNVYKSLGNKVQKLNNKPITATTDFVDKNNLYPETKYAYQYWVESIINGKKGEISEKVAVITRKADNEPAYRSITLRDGINAGRVGVGDLNGDGIYDYIVLHPNQGKDPSFKPDSTTLTYKIDAYLHDGTFLWSNDLGPGIEPGVWYSPFVIYDFNGDGKAEIAVKTGPVDARDINGRVTSGEEWFSIWDGMTGKEIAKADWIERGESFGDYNRNNRCQMAVAYLDGKTPCILTAKGTYRRMVVEAWQLNGTKLEKLWRWDGDEENPVVRSQGAHGISICDVDDDGRDEIILGSAVLDDNGTLLWSAGLGHPDKVYVTDIDPSRPGLEVFFACEVKHEDGKGVSVRDAKTGAEVWSIGKTTYHVGDGMVTDLDPSRQGLECFATEDSKGGSTDKYMFDAKGNMFASNDEVPGCRNWIWWDADKVRETFGRERNPLRGSGSDDISPEDRETWRNMMSRGMSIVKYKGDTLTTGIKGRIMLTGDLYGDWREEIVTALPGELRIYSTTIPAKDRMITLMQDNTYRQKITTHTMGYQQSPIPSFYLGE